jgi:hypothetical protein
MLNERILTRVKICPPYFAWGISKNFKYEERPLFFEERPLFFFFPVSKTLYSHLREEWRFSRGRLSEAKSIVPVIFRSNRVASG